jgi:hypothetical protein
MSCGECLPSAAGRPTRNANDAARGRGFRVTLRDQIWLGIDDRSLNAADLMLEIATRGPRTGLAPATPTQHGWRCSTFSADRL